MFIVFEGGEGAGKSTQARRLADHLRAAGHEVVLTREPGGTPIAEDFRRLVVEGDPDRMDAATELLAFTAARRDHLRRLIRPALEAGKIVICDRFLGSTLALQAEVPREIILDLHRDFCFGQMSDLTVLLDVPAEAGLARTMTRPGQVENRMESKGVEFHTRVVKNFRALAAGDPSWARIDATEDIETIEKNIRVTVESRLRKFRAAA